MKVVLSDHTIIECTIDELEELVARGIIGDKLKETKDELGIHDKQKPIWPSTPKMPSPWSQVVAVYGCVQPNNYGIEPHFEQSQFKSAVNTVVKLDGTVLGDNDSKIDSKE